jgi:adenylate cyclase
MMSTMSYGSEDDRAAAETAAMFDAVLDPARAERTVSPAQIEAEGGLTVDETRLLVLNLGLPAPDPREPYFTAAEADVFVRFGSLREIWPPAVYLQIARVYGQALAHIAQTEINMFRLYIEPTLRSVTGGPARARQAVQEAFGELLPLADPILLGVHRRRVEYELTQVAVRAAEIRTHEGVLPGTIEVTFAFCDLKDFSAYADAHGDRAAADLIERLAVVITGELGHHGHVVKALGDGFMLTYREPGEAVTACMRIIEQMRGAGAPGVHASVHQGVVLYREGDYFGRAVNLAARLLGLAGRDEIFASEEVVRATAGRFDWESRATQGIRGFSEPICVYRLRAPSPA